MFVSGRWPLPPGTAAGWGTVCLAIVFAGAFVACPSLSAIGVASSEGGVLDGAPGERSVDARGADAKSHDGDACAHGSATDPLNCGACGHDCGGGKCLGGVCQSAVILTGILQPFGIAVSGPNLYFTSSDSVVRMCEANACADNLTMMTTGQNSPTSVTTNTTNVYWANEGFSMEGGLSGGVATCGLAGCTGGAATPLATNEFGVVDLAIDSTSVYWTEGFSGHVYSCPASGCVGGTPKTLATLGGTVLLSGAAVDSTSVYFVEQNLGNVFQCPLSGCVGTPTPFASEQVKPSKVDVTDDMLYWSTSHAIMSCPTTGCGGVPTVFAANQENASALAHDQTTLYWALYELNGKVMSCPLSVGGAACKDPTVVAEQQGVPTRIAVDDTAIYWTDQSAGTIVRVIK
jgi:hypothetical protein